MHGQWQLFRVFPAKLRKAPKICKNTYGIKYVRIGMGHLDISMWMKVDHIHNVR